MTTELEFYNNGKPRTIVSFTGIGHSMGAIQLNEFFRLTKSGFNVLFVKDTTQSWYNNLDVAAIRNVLTGKPVITIGNSMGAYHAAMFALDYPVGKVIAFAVQYSIHPEIVPFDRRYRRYTKAIGDWKYRELQLNQSTEYYFISGDERMERRHLDMIPKQANVHTTVIPNADHKVAKQLKQKGQLYSLINEIINSPLTAPHHRAAS